MTGDCVSGGACDKGGRLRQDGMSGTRSYGRIVFLGGAATRVLARFYRSQIGSGAEARIAVGGTGLAARVSLEGADAVVMEVDDTGDPVPPAELPSGAKIVRLPALVADFLWPYAGRPHPKNRGPFPIPGGPYPADHGDRFLDRMMSEGVPEDEAVRRYLALDIAREGDLDRKFQARLTITRQLDRACGTTLAPLLQKFREAPLFASRTRPTAALLTPLTQHLFDRLGLERPDEAALRFIELPTTHQPLHPGVIAHFGLTYATPDATYSVIDEGEFTFEEYCRRYLNFAWNERLQRGFKRFKIDPKSAVADLEAGLAKSPRSARGRRALEAALDAAGLGPPDSEAEVAETEPAAPEAGKPPVASAAAAVEPGMQETAAGVVRFSAPARPSVATEVEDTEALRGTVSATEVPPAPPAPTPEAPQFVQAPATFSEDALSEALPSMRPGAEETELSFAAIADAALRPPLPFDLPPEPPIAAPKKKPGLIQRLLGME